MATCPSVPAEVNFFVVLNKRPATITPFLDTFWKSGEKNCAGRKTSPRFTPS
jgi:hypothetical protein